MTEVERERFQFHVAQAVEHARSAAQKTHEECAQAIGVSRDYMGRVCRGTKALSLWNAYQLSVFLDVPLDKMVEGVLVEVTVPEQPEGLVRIQRALAKLDPSCYPCIHRFITFIRQIHCKNEN